MTQLIALSFDSASQLDNWLKEHNQTDQELWIRIYKKSSKIPSVTWDDCVVSAIAWGWIDGQKQSLDEQSYLQRFTPRRKNSTWSQRNCGHAERLIAEGKMQAPGLAQVEAAKQNGRWDSAYAGSSTMEIPQDFLAELCRHPLANQKYQSLNKSKLFLIYHRLQTAQKAETRNQRIEMLIKRIEDDSL